MEKGKILLLAANSRMLIFVFNIIQRNGWLINGYKGLVY